MSSARLMALDLSPLTRAARVKLSPASRSFELNMLNAGTGAVAAQPSDHAQAELHGRNFEQIFQGGVHVAVHHVHRSHLDAMTQRVLRGAIHRASQRSPYCMQITLLEKI